MSFIESILYMAWRGVAIGLIISAPMGPVGMLCIQRTLDKGRRAGFYTGVGAAFSDLFYSLLTGFGLSFIEEFLERNQNIIQLAGSAVLIAFGIYLFRKNPTKGLKKPELEEISAKKNILGGFLFTFSNPLILFLIIGLFARFNFLLPEFHVYQYFTGFFFIFVGALLWWWLITFSIDKVRSHFNLRSMWLINRIIGAIIMIFAVVGIITATTALASATDISCWNSNRGYGPFSSLSSDSAEPNLLLNETSDTLTFLAPCEGATATEFRCKIKNHRASPTRSYEIKSADGQTSKKVKNPPWGFILKGTNNETVYVDITQGESESDGISTSPVLMVNVRLDGAGPSPKSFADKTNIVKKLKDGMSGPDPTGSLNFFKLVAFNDVLTLFGGIHTPEALLSAPLPENFMADSIGLYLAPGACISPEELRLTSSRPMLPSSVWNDPDFISTYLEGSRDPMEGYWQILDRSLEETLLRAGGDYRLAIIRADDGYDLIYLSGARVNSEAWQLGMVKAHLAHSGIQGVWDVVWNDAMGQPLSYQIKAQRDQYGVLTIQFPYQNSQLRLVQTR